MEKKEIKEPAVVNTTAASLMLKIASTKTINELVDILGVEEAKNVINILLKKYE